MIYAAVKGPFAARGYAAVAMQIALVTALTLTTQVGGLIAWPFLGWAARARSARQRGIVLLAFAATYTICSALVLPATAAKFGRTALPCRGSGPLRPHSFVYCAMNRHYVTPPLQRALIEVAEQLAANDSGAPIPFLDAGFPFGFGFPMLPHLSHGDGRKVDLAIPLLRGGSPVGYLAYVPVDGTPACPSRWFDLR